MFIEVQYSCELSTNIVDLAQIIILYYKQVYSNCSMNAELNFLSWTVVTA